jgi:hypothetical protein
MPHVGFESTIPESKRAQINALEGAAAGVGVVMNIVLKTSVPAWQRTQSVSIVQTSRLATKNTGNYGCCLLCQWKTPNFASRVLYDTRS